MNLTSASDTLAASDRSLEHLLYNTDHYVIAVEIETSRGLASENRWRRIVDYARQVSDLDQVDLISITDNPGGHPHLSPEVLGAELMERGREVNIHVCCKDANRNGLESRLWALNSEGFRNILALTGDYPVEGFKGQALPVFDIDSVGLLELVRQMDAGLTVPGLKAGSTESYQKASLFPGAVVSPFKQHEGEHMTQLFKLALKIETGARYIITQIGYDSRKFDELLKYMALKGLNAPVIGNVYVLTAPVARFFNRGTIPGVIVSNELVEVANAQEKSPDKGKSFFLELAAKQIAILKGLGYRGAYIGGRLKADEVHTVLEIERSFSPDDWKQFAREIIFPQPNEFYYFERDAETGLSSTQISKAYLASKTPAGMAELRRRTPLGYKFSRLTHDAVFDRGSLGFKLGQQVYKRLDQSNFFHTLEQAVKIPMFGCHDCGDCALPDIAYLCPESQCVKNMRNGPCGGTHQDTCEIGEKDCIWARAYYRLKAYGQEETMLRRPVIFKDGRLRGTSAWANTFLGRDHHGRTDQD